MNVLTRIGICALALTLCYAVNAEPKPQRVAVNGIELSVLSAGKQSAQPAVVFMTGWRITKDVWRPHLAKFSKDRLAVAFDPRSQGESTVTASGDTPEQRARDLSSLLDKLQLNSIVLVAWSQGVQDAAAYLREFGTRRLTGIVLVDAPISTGATRVRTAPDAVARQLELLDVYARSPQEYTEGMLSAIVSKPLPAAEHDALLGQAMKTPEAIGAAMLVADLLGADRTDALAKIDKPTQIIAAGRSPELEAQRAMAAKIPNARFEVVADAAHALFIDQPERFDELLERFIANLN